MFSNASNSSVPVQAPPLAATSYCFLLHSGFTIFFSFSVSNVVAVLPFCLSVCVIGVRRRCWRRPTTHSDAFTYYLVAMETVSVAACAVYVRGFAADAFGIMFKSMRVYSFTALGQLHFHILTCLDRYAAVVHPITYLRLKERGGVRLRNALVAGAWLLFAVKVVIGSDFDAALQFFYLSFSVAVVVFCNLAVLFVLLRPPPGERVTVSQSKRRAFNTIMVILCVLLFRMIMHLIVVGVYESTLLSMKLRCGALLSGVFFSLPSSLVLPTLFLYRAKVLSKQRSASPATATSS